MKNKEWLAKIIKEAKSGEFNDGVYHTKPNEVGLAIVIGWEDGYDKEEDLIQQVVGKDVYTLCGKVAYNCDDLQCDYDIDWYMPWDKSGDVYTGSEITIVSVEDMDYLLSELKYATDCVKKGLLIIGEKK